MRISFWFLFQFIIFNNYSYCQTFSESDILGEYLSIKDHPKAKDVNLKLRVPIGWEVREGDRPNIVKKFVRDLNMYTIIIKENITFFSRKQSKELLEGENYLDELVQEVSSFLNNPEIIDKSVITIDTYPTVQFKVKGELEQMGLTLPIVSKCWIIFYEDKFILLQSMGFDNAEYRALEGLYLLITNSVILPDQYN